MTLFIFIGSKDIRINFFYVISCRGERGREEGERERKGEREEGERERERERERGSKAVMETEGFALTLVVKEPDVIPSPTSSERSTFSRLNRTDID